MLQGYFGMTEKQGPSGADWNQKMNSLFDLLRSKNSMLKRKPSGISESETG
jgi:hypothetical protein